MEPKLPSRYEPAWRLGQGGGGEVWAVRDRIADRVVALKVLAKDASKEATHALVREAVTLSGLEGLGVPRVLDFGTLEDGRRFMVRELVDGRSLEELLEKNAEGDAKQWLVPLAHAADQLTALHRAGMLHGDVKPANVIVEPGGRGTLVDLGLSVAWREGGATARGLTPRYAAPELLTGAPLTVRAEVYALGATLADGLSRRAADLAEPVRLALTKVAARATERDPAARYPSVDELASALRHAAGIARPLFLDPGWPVVGLDAITESALVLVRAMGPGEGVALDGPADSGRTTIARRVAWTLGVEGRAVVTLSGSGNDAGDELAGADVIVVDDFVPGGSKLRQASKRGARVVAVSTADALASTCAKDVRAFVIPPLDARDANDLVLRAVPSLSEALAAYVVERADARPGRLRRAVRALAGRAVVSRADIDATTDAATRVTPTLADAEELLATGRIHDAERALASMALAPALEIPFAIARAKLLTARGDGGRALETLAPLGAAARASEHARAFAVAWARAALRAGRYDEAIESAQRATDADGERGVQALAAIGVAEALRGNDSTATTTLIRAVDVAREARDRRAEGLALGSLAIVHQRAGRMTEAKAAYESSLAAAEEARDAATVAAGRLNLAGLARADGDLSAALAHLEATVDLGNRAGGVLAVQQARFNLANLDLFLGRYARASAAIDALEREHAELGRAARAQLVGLRAELAARTGDVASAARLYEESARAWEAQGRAIDACEARLESIVARARSPRPNVHELGLELERTLATIAGGDRHEHVALALLARGAVESLHGREESARKAYDDAHEAAQKGGQRERAWQALAFRAELFQAQGSATLARRDLEAALAILEEIASKLPRDLREVFWDAPERRKLRQPAAVTRAPLGALPLASITLSTETVNARRARAEPDRLARVLEIIRELAGEHELARLLTKVTDHAIALLGGERGFVVLRGETGGLETHTARDRAGDDPHAEFSRSVAERVVRSGEPVVTTSAREDERLAAAVSVHQLMIQSVACVPVRGHDGGTIGALYVETRLQPGVRFEQELPTLTAFADQAAIAIENARLVAELRQRTGELEQKSVELEAAKEKLAEALDRRTEQLAVTRQSLRQARAELRSHFGYAGLVGTSAAMRKVYALIDRVKDTDVPVLVTGESGTGKEVVARAIHQTGPRAKRAFLGVNCGAIPANLLESELFGHVRGAFTGADRDRRGLFREAEGGTLLLDEIGEMPLKMQPALLRTLQEKTVRPVGSAKEEPVDVRLVAATNRDLEQMVQEGTFREDLFYRLHVIEVRIPPLRERAEDIPALIDHFLGIFAARHHRERKSVDRVALRKLSSYHWPGNVRQLEHVLLNAWLMGEGDELRPDDFALPDSVTTAQKSDHRARLPKTEQDFKEGERERILRALTACNWNRVQAAKMSGIPRRTFYRRLKEFGII